MERLTKLKKNMIIIEAMKFVLFEISCLKWAMFWQAPVFLGFHDNQPRLTATKYVQSKTNMFLSVLNFFHLSLEINHMIVIPDQTIWKQRNMFSSMFEVAEDYVDLVERCSLICLFPWIICMVIRLPEWMDHKVTHHQKKITHLTLQQ